MRLKPVTDGDRTFWEWRSSSGRRSRREELTALVRGGIYRAGFAAIGKMFGGRAGRPPLRRRLRRDRAPGRRASRNAYRRPGSPLPLDGGEVRARSTAERGCASAEWRDNAG